MPIRDGANITVDTYNLTKYREESHMAETQLVGRCGLYCGACTIYRAYKDNGEFQTRVAAFFKCPPEKIRCEGCRALTPECWGNDCKIVQCTTAKGFSYCYECPQFDDKSCEKYDELASRYLEDKIDTRANLARIKSGQLEAWLNESTGRFKCPFCGKALPEGRENCYHCGKGFGKML